MGSRILDGVYEERSHPYLTVEQRLRTSEEGGLYVESQVLRLGNMPFVAMGGECLFDTARIIESAVGDCMVVSYANDYVGYLPTREQYGKGGYEQLGRTSCRDRGCKDVKKSVVAVSLKQKNSK